MKNDPTTDYCTIAFYNLENLFDTVDDDYHDDDDFLPDSDRKWTQKRYKKKIRKLGYTIAHIGASLTNKPPAIVGLAEVENMNVVEDLIMSKFLVEHNYDFVHFDSPDERGIDVALIYRKEVFEEIHAEAFPIKLYDEHNNRDYTRDILLVNGKLNGEEVHIVVNHWPSRREGVELTEPSRIIASEKVSEIIYAIRKNNPDVKLIIMGDFNDDPKSKSIKRLIHEHDLYNPMENLMSYHRGSLNHQLQWNLFDQILFSTNFFEATPNKHRFSKADIFDKEFLKQFKGKYKGSPFRTYVGRRYKGGYSDHFPVYIQLKKN